MKPLALIKQWAGRVGKWFTGGNGEPGSQFLDMKFGSWAGCLLTVLATVPFLTEFYGGYFTRRSYDLPFKCRETSTADEVVLVYMDEQSHRSLRQGYDKPWDRERHVQLLERLMAEGASSVVFDVVFNRGHSESLSVTGKEHVADQHLAAAMKRHGQVIIGSHVRVEHQPGFGMEFKQLPEDLPEPLLAGAAKGIGIVDVVPDEDAVVRRFPAKAISSKRYPTLAWLAAAQENAPAASAEPRRNASWLNYYGPPGSLTNHSYATALTNELPTGYFSNKVVVVGMNYDLNVPGLPVDMFASPFGPRRYPGAEIHATAILNLLRGDYLRRLPVGWEILVQTAIAAAFGFGLPRLRPVTATLAALGGAVGLAIVAIWLHRSMHFWWPWLVPIGSQIPVALGWSLVFYTLKNRFLESSLSLYLSPRLVRRIMQRPALLKLGGTTREISMMFTDLQGFSKVAERLDPDDLLQLLNRYYEEAIACVHETDGTVIAISGDSIFAVWNAPEDQAGHAALAGRTALSLHQKAMEMEAQGDTPPLRTRVGLHIGKTCVGNIGNARHLAYTAIGESVNLASRLEGANKILGTGILASRDFIKAAGGVFTSRLVGLFKVKGFHGVVDVFELVGLAEGGEGSRVWRDVFQRGVAAFQRLQFDEAEHHFKRVLRKQKCETLISLGNLRIRMGVG
jgi:adenylate cyclase